MKKLALILALVIFFLFPNTSLAKSGCCSWHDGVCGCSGGRQLCCDGTLSPSCTCGYVAPVVTTAPVKTFTPTLAPTIRPTVIPTIASTVKLTSTITPSPSPISTETPTPSQTPNATTNSTVTPSPEVKGTTTTSGGSGWVLGLLGLGYWIFKKIKGKNIN